MSTKKYDISDWFDRGLAQGASHLIVVCDTFSYEGYPTFCVNKEECLKKLEELRAADMTRVMEVYNLSMDKELQLEDKRAWNI